MWAYRTSFGSLLGTLALPFLYWGWTKYACVVLPTNSCSSETRQLYGQPTRFGGSRPSETQKNRKTGKALCTVPPPSETVGKLPFALDPVSYSVKSGLGLALLHGAVLKSEGPGSCTMPDAGVQS